MAGEIKAGPGWIFLQGLNPEDLSEKPGHDTSPITNLLYNKEVKATFQPKKYKVEPDNASGAAEVFALGLESCQITENLLSIDADVLAMCLAEARAAYGTPRGATDVINITGRGRMPYFRLIAIFPDMVANTSIFGAIEDGTALTVDVIEMRIAALGGEAVEYAALPDKERELSFVAEGITRPGITAVPAKMKLGATIDASILNTASPTGWPITPSLYGDTIA